MVITIRAFRFFGRGYLTLPFLTQQDKDLVAKHLLRYVLREKVTH